MTILLVLDYIDDAFPTHYPSKLVVGNTFATPLKNPTVMAPRSEGKVKAGNVANYRAPTLMVRAGIVK